MTAQSFLPYYSDDKVNQMYSDIVGSKIEVERKSKQGWMAKVGATLHFLTSSIQGQSMEEVTEVVPSKRIDVAKAVVKQAKDDSDFPKLNEYPDSSKIYYEVSGEFGFYRHPTETDLLRVEGITDEGIRFESDCSKSNFSSGSWYARADSDDGIYIDGYGVATVFNQDGESDTFRLHFGFIAQTSGSFSTESEQLN